MGDSDDDADGSALEPSETVTSPASEFAIPDLSRLPKNVEPKRYELKMEVDPQKKIYTGLVNIRLYFRGAHTTRIVWLHAAKNVRVESAHVWFSQFLEMPIQTAEVIRVPEKECIGVRFITPVREGDRAWLGIHFRGNILDGMQGLFSTTYVDKNGERKLGAATMFAATEARTCKVRPEGSERHLLFNTTVLSVFHIFLNLCLKKKSFAVAVRLSMLR